MRKLGIEVLENPAFQVKARALLCGKVGLTVLECGKADDACSRLCVCENRFYVKVIVILF